MDFLINYYTSFFNALIKNKYRFSVADIKNVHAHIVITLITSFIMFAYTIFAYLAIENKFVFYTGLICSLVHLMTILFYRFSTNVFMIAFTMLLAGGIFETVFAYYTGGVTSNVLTWYGVMPIFGGIVLGRIGAFLWSVIVSCLSLFFIAIEILDKTPQNSLTPELQIASHALLLFCFIFLSSICVFIYLIYKDKSDLELISQKNKYKKLVSVLLHDISGPVTICKNYLSQLDLFLDEAHPSSRAMVRVNKAIDSIAEIVGSVKQMHKYQDGRVQIYLEKVKFRDCVLRSLASFEDVLYQKNIQVQFEFDSCEESCVRVDRVLLEKQVLANVFKNTIKFSGDNQIIYLKISRMSDHNLRLRIIDKGAGIPQNILASLFLESNLNNPFNKDGEVTSGHSLMMAKEFLELFEGSIKIESVSRRVDYENHGTIVDIYLPDYSDL